MIIGVSGKIGSGNRKPEEWKDCIDNLNYQISNYGKVRSKDKQVSGKLNSIATKHGKILSPANFNGYLGIKFSDHSGRTTALIHILVAKAFIDNPENKCCVNHKYGDKHDNYYENLEWNTYSENMYHASKTGLTQTGERHYNSKLSNEEVLEIKAKYQTGKYSHNSLGKEYGVTKQNITMILNNKSRKS
jgi:hypothetical protein